MHTSLIMTKGLSELSNEELLKNLEAMFEMEMELNIPLKDRFYNTKKGRELSDRCNFKKKEENVVDPELPDFIKDMAAALQGSLGDDVEIHIFDLGPILERPKTYNVPLKRRSRFQRIIRAPKAAWGLAKTFTWTRDNWKENIQSILFLINQITKKYERPKDN